MPVFLLKNDKNAIVAAEYKKENLRYLLSYFHSRVPDISAATSKKLPRKYHKKLWAEIEQAVPNSNLTFVLTDLDYQKGIKDFGLCEQRICPKRTRSVCIKPKTTSEFDCFVRHIRNAIAHTSVYGVEEKRPNGQSTTYFLFVDIDAHNNNMETARIVCKGSDLEKWRAAIIKQLKEYEESVAQGVPT